MQRSDTLGGTCSLCPGFPDVSIAIKSNNPEFESHRFTFEPNIAARERLGWHLHCGFFWSEEFSSSKSRLIGKKVSLCLEFPLISDRFADCRRAAFMTLHMIAAKYPGRVIASGVWRMCSKCSQLFKLSPPVSGFKRMKAWDWLQFLIKTHIDTLNALNQWADAAAAPQHHPHW